MIDLACLALLVAICQVTTISASNVLMISNNQCQKEELLHVSQAQKDNIERLKKHINSHQCLHSQKQLNLAARTVKRASAGCADKVISLYSQTKQLRDLDSQYNILENRVLKFKRLAGISQNNATEECKKKFDAVGPPRIVLRVSSDGKFKDVKKYIAWMKDFNSSNDDRIWVTRGYGPIHDVYEYLSESHFRANDTNIVYRLPFACMGTGHIVYNGALYCHKWRTNTIVKYDFSEFKVLKERNLGYSWSNYGRYYYHYQDGHTGGYDLAVDEFGLYVVYASTTSSGADIWFDKLDPNDLSTLETWKTTLDKRNTQDTFMMCGTLYGVYYSHYINKRQCFYNRYNTKTTMQYANCNETPKFPAYRYNNLGTNMYLYYLSYNPRDKTLLATTDQTLISYNLYTKYS